MIIIKYKFYNAKQIFAKEMTHAKKVLIFFNFFLYITYIQNLYKDHKGPLCEGCMISNRAVKEVSGECESCKTDSAAALILGITFLCFTLIVLFQIQS